MHLPWPFRRSAPERGAAASGATVGAAVDVAPPVRRTEWREVGRLRPSFAADPGIRVQRFRDELAGSQLPPPVLGPLGHARTADGPAGLVSGLTRPVVGGAHPGSAPVATLALRSRPRVPLQRDAVASDDVTGSGEMSETIDGPVLPTPLVRQAPTVRDASPSAASSMLTVARTPQLVGAPMASASPARAVPALPGDPAGAAPGTLASVPAGARTIIRGPGGSRVRLGAPIQREALQTAGSTIGDRPLLPNPATPATSSVAAATPDATAAPSGDARTTGDAPLVGTLRGAPGPISPPADASDVVTTAVPGGLVLARVVHAAETSPSDAVHKAAPSASDEPSDPPAGRRSDGRGAMAPLVGRMPLEPTAWPPSPPGHVAGMAGPTRVGHVPTPTTSPATARSAAGPRWLQRDVSDGVSASSTDIPVGRSSAVPAPGGEPLGWASMSRPSQPTASPAGDLDPVTAPRRHAVMVAGSASVAGGVGLAAGHASARTLQRHASATPAVGTHVPVSSSPDTALPLQLARTTSLTPVTTVGAAARPSLPTAARATPGAATGRMTMQRAPDDTPDDPSGTSSVAATPAGEAPTVTAPAPGASASPLAGLAERDLDEMVRRLYPRLRRSLSSELLVARERAGVLADLR